MKPTLRVYAGIGVAGWASPGPRVARDDKRKPMNRREFFAQTLVTTGGLLSLPSCVRESPLARGTPIRRIHWSRAAKSRLFSAVSLDGASLVRGDTPGLLEGGSRLLDEPPAQMTWLNAGRPVATDGPLRSELGHQLRDSGRGLGEDMLEATLTVRNTSGQPQRVELAFATSAQPSAAIEQQQVSVPLSAAGGSGDDRFAALGVTGFLQDCHQRVGRGEFQAHYLEPMASYPAERLTRALLLAPVVDISHPQAAVRIGLFTSSLEPRRFSTLDPAGPSAGWCMGRCVTLPPGQGITERCWLLLHEGDARVAWQTFHRFAHREDHPLIAWTCEFKVHYYDFLSSTGDEKGKRGGGYEADVPHFREFRVGLATQHGYYPWLGDYIHPDRATWQAMRGDKQGAAEMSFDKMRARLQATRAAGAKAAIYLHPVLLDDAAPLDPKLRDSVLVDAAGERVPYPWQGPDTAGKNWRASLASRQWREHLLQQAQWIMEILKPDAITVDETFAGLGYDYHPDHAGPTSGAAIDFYRRLRSLVRSFGTDKAVFTSDCSMAPFVLWADGECGDHAYDSLLGHPLYRQEPVRYLAALGDKPWRPCAWHFQHAWEMQMKLARQVGAGVGVSNGWIEYTGLARLPAEVKTRMLRDIQSLFDSKSP
jgi:hypothetical protein